MHYKSRVSLQTFGQKMIEALKKRALTEENALTEPKDGPLALAPLKKHKAVEEDSVCDKENIGETDTLPRGLYNESNTCYLNSLIQVLFHLIPLREVIFRLTPRSPAQHAVAMAQIDFTCGLRGFHVYREFWTPDMEDVLTKLKVLEALQWLFIDLEEGTDGNEIVTTNRLTKAFGWTSVNRGLQQDIHEFMQTLFNSLEKELLPDDFVGLASLLVGKLKRSIKCEVVGYESIKFEEVRGLSLPTISFISIERSLEDMFKSEQLQMTIEGHGKQTAEMQVELVDTPKILLLNLNRLKYDPVEQAVVKVTDFFEYKRRLELSGHTYRLHSAVIHEGTADSGHYYCYISPTCDNKWYMFNDDKVCRSSISAAIRENYGKKSDPAGPTAYLLTYIREDCTEFFKPNVPRIPDSLRARIADIRQMERARLERIQTAHLYTTVSLVPWAMMKEHMGYDLCDRYKLDQIHKEGESSEVTTHGVTTHKVLKSSAVRELAVLHHPGITQDNVRLWAFTDKETNDGWGTHRPSKLIKDWNLTVAMVSKLRCPFYIYVEWLDSELHPCTLYDGMLSVFIKVFHNTLGAKDKSLRLEHHIIVSIDATIDSIRSTVFQLSNIDPDKYSANIYQEHSSMMTEKLDCDGDSPLCDALSAQVIRHACILILEIFNLSATGATAPTSSRISVTDGCDSTGQTTPNSQNISVSNPIGNDLVSNLSKKDEESIEGSAAVGSVLIDHMRKLGTRVQVTWYNKSQSYLPSHTDGDFSLELYSDMSMRDVAERLSKHLDCGLRNLLLYEAKRDQGYPQLQDKPAYDSESDVSLMKLVYRQVQHSILWRHSAVLFYEKLAMSIEEMSVRHTLTCSYVSADMVTHVLTLYPHKFKEDCEEPATVKELLELARKEMDALPGRSTRPLRVLILYNKRIAAVLPPDHHISSLLLDELRLEYITEEEEESETEFSEILASVSIDSAYLSRRGVHTEPFLIVIDRSDTGIQIAENINTRLKIQKEWTDKLDYRLVIPGEIGYALPDCRLSVKDWGNLACDDDTGSFEGCNYIKLMDAFKPC
ncbi:ubiquitin carboxyl-terminal hydrolase 7-like [Watersipora subatra]|uniref:ubiquitin carboxyl-terminal hydrolase 7-like n=1 Tax=Watersipora subatra TaxID=2589382 RepID=UPI00355C01F2